MGGSPPTDYVIHATSTFTKVTTTTNKINVFSHPIPGPGWCQWW